MKRTILLPGILSLLLFAGACSPTAARVGPAVDQITLAADKALYAAEAAYAGALHAAEAAVDAGLLKGAAAGRVADLLEQAKAALDAARAADVMGDAVTAQIKAVAALSLIADAQRNISAQR